MPVRTARPARYIIMPQEGLEHPFLTGATFQPAARRVAVAARAAATTRPQMQVLDAIGENGPKLVEMPPEGELSLRLTMPGIKIVPEVFYHRLWHRLEVEKRASGPVKAKVALAAAKSAAVEIRITDRSTGQPVRGAHIVAFTDFANRIGAEANSAANGRARLNGITSKQKIERLYIYGPPGYWGFYRTNTSGAALAAVQLRPVNIQEATLLLRQLYGNLPGDAGKGVTVAVIDSGVDGGPGRHPDLANVTGGLNCVSDEVRADPAAARNWGPAKVEGEHGTHVAGIIGASGGPNGFRGVAPGVMLRSYRVFPDTGDGASNFDIARAIETAVADRCDIINLSLGGGPKDDLTKAAIDRALAAGVAVVAAAGNENRSPVAFPAAFPECTAVSAMGRRGSFPSESTGAGDTAKPTGGAGSSDFVAAFSNIGPEVDVTGPGVEIVSTLPDRAYGPMSGTSMASPAVAGFAAHLLSANAALRQAAGSDRSRQLKDLLYSKCKPEGFGREFEGFGLPLS
jgi:subtilisin